MKKLIYITTISFLLINLASCYISKALTNPEEFTQCLKKKNDCYSINKNIKVLCVITKEKDTLFFSKKYPCRIDENYIVGLPQIIFPFSVKFDSISFQKNYLKTMWKDGSQYSFINIDESGFLCCKMDTLNIPLAEVEKAYIAQSKNGATAVLAIGSAGTVAFVTIAAISMQQMGDLFDDK
jgi:hypothetical protein